MRISICYREFGSERRLIAKSKDDSPFIPASRSTRRRFDDHSGSVRILMNKPPSSTARFKTRSQRPMVFLREGDSACVSLMRPAKNSARPAKSAVYSMWPDPDPPSPLVIFPKMPRSCHIILCQILYGTGVQSAGNIIRYKIRVAPMYSGQNERFCNWLQPAMYEKITTATSIRYGQDGALFSMTDGDWLCLRAGAQWAQRTRYAQRREKRNFYLPGVKERNHRWFVFWLPLLRVTTM